MPNDLITSLNVLNKQYAAIKTIQDQWLPDWRDLSDMYKPTVSQWLFNDKNRRDQKSGRRNTKIIDGTGLYARRALQAGMMSGLSSPSRPWLRAVIPDPELMEIANVSRWLHAVETRVLDVFSRSNFYDVLQQEYGDWGVFGNMSFNIDEESDKIINCVPYAIGSYYGSSNAYGMVDTIFRRASFNCRQMVEKFGKDKVSKTCANAYDAGNYYQSFDVIHAVLPNSDRDYGSESSANMPIKSCWWEPQESQYLLESGYNEHPTIFARWELDSAEDDIGVGPGMIGLGAARALQLQQKRKAKAIDKHIEPPLVADPMLKNDVISTIPGDVSYAGFLPNGSAPRVQPIYQTNPNIQGLLEDINELKQEIQKAMFTDVFLMFVNRDGAPLQNPEVYARETEKALMLGPVVERGKTEIFQPAFDRVFNILVRRSMPYWEGKLHGDPLLPPPPEELHDVPLKVELISVLAQAQKAVALTGIERLANFVGTMSTAQANLGQPPLAADKLDFDQTIDEYAQALGTSPNLVRSDDEVAKLRKQRADAQAQAQQQAQASQSIQNLKGGAQAAKTLSETNMGDSTALDKLVGAA